MTETSKGLTRRQLLKGSATTLAVGAAATAKAASLTAVPQWIPFDHNGPMHYDTPGWQFFSEAEAAAVEAIVARLIPADDLSVSGKDAGCAVFIDRQLAGEYGTFSRLYMQGPFEQGTPMQGDQSALVPRDRYRLGLAGLDAYCQKQFHKRFSDLAPEEQDTVLTGLEKGEIVLDGIDSKLFFQQVLGNTMEGFFADPVYGGNRDMVSWKMIGFPGARYDYRDYIGLHNQKLDLVPLSIAGSAAWTKKG
ncbi:MULTISPECIES: gluconate 2-dehydrogenase subunit 3 family protein [unclassified Pseudomonas]|uniref:gluconate 2-dehydrogenase subunit 3 family protein n=1 Tax=unclassified Pseudomonas TaxID=196821 RepID=UPI000D3CA3C8|nr:MULTISPECIES: gluconate 2-dehydrogenase subunit 3 family protein [unclassified Pseudomonas]RAU39476.1 gluconate 2-dehydrogenase subunit 3 family protein [Pseudomonas sp. RIT 409]RAU56327.1 gluconate 2-dehydrogenase subunit 3 family protein [Pseudomonas sp. RIT 412]